MTSPFPEILNAMAQTSTPNTIGLLVRPTFREQIPFISLSATNAKRSTCCDGTNVDGCSQLFGTKH
jgi:hypothetical protein